MKMRSASVLFRSSAAIVMGIRERAVSSRECLRLHGAIRDTLRFRTRNPLSTRSATEGVVNVNPYKIWHLRNIRCYLLHASFK
jgi:hypothetical protein